MSSLDKAWRESWWDFPDGKRQDINRMETTVVSHVQSLQLPKISMARGSQFPWILFSEQEGPKAFPLKGCHLTPRSRHRASTCCAREMTYPWGNCSPASSPSKGHVGAVQGWTSEPSLNIFNLAFVWIKSRRQRARDCRKHLIKVLARLPPPCHIPSHDTSWLCSPAATLFAFEFTCYAQHSFHADERNHMLLEWNADSSESRFCSQGQEVSTEPENFVIHEEFIWNPPLS